MCGPTPILPTPDLPLPSLSLKEHRLIVCHKHPLAYHSPCLAPVPETCLPSHLKRFVVCGMHQVSLLHFFTSTLPSNFIFKERKLYGSVSPSFSLILSAICDISNPFRARAPCLCLFIYMRFFPQGSFPLDHFGDCTAVAEKYKFVCVFLPSSTFFFLSSCRCSYVASPTLPLCVSLSTDYYCSPNPTLTSIPDSAFLSSTTIPANAETLRRNTSSAAWNSMCDLWLLCCFLVDSIVCCPQFIVCSHNPFPPPLSHIFILFLFNYCSFPSRSGLMAQEDLKDLGFKGEQDKKK